MLRNASLYSELATGMYGSSMIYGVMGEIDSTDDVKRLLNGKKDREGYKQAFINDMDDDFNTADAMSEIYNIIREINPLVTGAGASTELVSKAYDIYNELVTLMGFSANESHDEALIKEIEELIEKRAEAKKAKNYAEADRIREYLAGKGVTLKDTKQGTQYTIG